MNKDFLEKLNALIIAAFGLVAALAWNTAIQEMFHQIFGVASGLWAMIFYAVIVTAIAVWVTMRMAKLTERATKLSNKAEKLTTGIKKKVAKKVISTLPKAIPKKVISKIKLKKKK
jgi:hypothetical protein